MLQMTRANIYEKPIGSQEHGSVLAYNQLRQVSFCPFTDKKTEVGRYIAIYPRSHSSGTGLNSCHLILENLHKVVPPPFFSANAVEHKTPQIPSRYCPIYFSPLILPRKCGLYVINNPKPICSSFAGQWPNNLCGPGM